MSMVNAPAVEVKAEEEKRSHSEASVQASVPLWVKHGRIPFLDGLRAIAIIVVIASHFGRQHYYDGINRFITGHMGVTLFFVISGFLITLLMLREYDKSGTISLSGFYKRRVLRIFPAYYAYLAVAAILWWAGTIRFSAKYWLGALTYTMCYFPARDQWQIGHTWSLAVEEHFYLLWPVTFLWLSPQKAWRVALAYFCITPVLRYFIWSRHSAWLDVDMASVTQMSSIAVGCIFAYILYGTALQKFNKALSKKPAITAVGGLLLLLVSAYAQRSWRYSTFLSDPVNAIAMALIMVGLLQTSTNSLMGRLLNSKPVVFVGILSYSLYLWQQLFTARTPALTRLPWYVLALFIFVTAAASYFFVERPFLRLKERKRNAAIV